MISSTSPVGDYGFLTINDAPVRIILAYIFNYSFQYPGMHEIIIGSEEIDPIVMCVLQTCVTTTSGEVRP
ncbi:MAG: hypothetical protein WCO26_23285, partial [Deltaproteobacteria bacterium]